MDESVKKSLRSACLSPMEHILKIIATKDTARAKLMAIQQYCNTTKGVIEKVMKDNNLEN